MVGQFDPTKTPENMYRIGINCRIRKNAIEAAFAPVRVNTPNYVHQALFALDDKLVVVIAGDIYNVPLDTLAPVLLRADALSGDVDTVYHALVPAPTNFFMKDGALTPEYNSAVATQPECAVLQDGTSQPYRVLSNLACQPIGAYAEWTFDTPEYVPIGKQMAYSGNVLYVVSPDGKKIYRSVSGRPLDFVLNISDTGEKLGDADTSNLAVSAAPLTAIQPAQGGGFIATTYYNTYAGVLDIAVDDYFGEPYIQPVELFPVGAVSQFAFTNALGDTVFVSSAGLRSFNQIQQTKWESNNSALGAPIFDYLVRPITSACTAVADDYVFFGLSTVFGDGIVVWDTRLEQFVSIDLVGSVKQFAVVRAGGIDRLFFITTANELFELPLYAGTRQTFSILFGHYCAQDGFKLLKPAGVVAQFNGISGSGTVTCRTIIDNAIVATNSIDLTATTPTDNLLSASPRAFSLGSDTQMTPIVFDHAEVPQGYAVAFELTCSANARLVSFVADMGEQTVDQPQIPLTVASLPVANEVFALLGNINPDSTQTGTEFSGLITGNSYTFHAGTVAAILRNGGNNLSLALRNSQSIPAAADRLNASASSSLFSYQTADNLFAQVTRPRNVFLLGALGGTTYHSHAFMPAWRAAGRANTFAVISDADQTTETSKDDYFGLSNGPIMQLIETEFVNFFLVNFYLPTADLIIDADGNLPVTPDDMLATGRMANWISVMIREMASDKFNVVLFGYPPYSGTSKYAPGLAALRWNFRRMGVDAVIANSKCYERYYTGAVHYLNAGSGSAVAGLQNSDDGLAVPGILRLTATSNLLAFDFIDEDGKLRDRTTIVG